MTKLWWVVFLVAFQFVGAAPTRAGGQPATARDYWLDVLGGTPGNSQFLAVSAPGTLWDNGPNDLVNGLTDERNTFINGNGGPDGNDASTIANDFLITMPSAVTEIRVCLYHDGTTAEMYIYQDNGGVPGPPVTSPFFGSPTTAHVVSTTFSDNTTRCQSALGLTGRQYVFNAATTGVPLPKLSPGRYWLAVVGVGGTRAFWTTSTLTAPPAAQASLSAVWGSTFFGTAYWTPTTTTHGASFKEFAFDIDGHGVASQAPALSSAGLACLAVLLCAIGMGALRCLPRRG